MLADQERTTLLRVARDSITARFERRLLDWNAYDLTEALSRHGGAFVTLDKRGELRGCIGTIVGIEPLYRSVATNALNAAFRDPRFNPLAVDELAEVAIEVSVMSPITPVVNIDEIVVGRDGLILRMGMRSGLLLPQVATEYGWDREAFLNHTALKAGIPADSWRTRKATIEKFSAEVFSEGAKNQ